jgi:hypothetical protein
MELDSVCNAAGDKLRLAESLDELRDKLAASLTQLRAELSSVETDKRQLTESVARLQDELASAESDKVKLAESVAILSRRLAESPVGVLKGRLGSGNGQTREASPACDEPQLASPEFKTPCNGLVVRCRSFCRLSAVNLPVCRSSLARRATRSSSRSQ